MIDKFNREKQIKDEEYYKLKNNIKKLEIENTKLKNENENLKSAKKPGKPMHIEYLKILRKK